MQLLSKFSVLLISIRGNIEKIIQMNTILYKIGASVVALLFGTSVFAQITITPITPNSAVLDVLLGTGVTALNVVYTGANVAMGKFVSSSASMPLASGIVITSGLASAVNSGASTQASTDNGTGSDPQLAALVTPEVKDAAVLEFDFIPESDTIRFRYVFGSEEYPEFVGDIFNDIFGFFITGANPVGGSYSNKNIALIPGTNTPVSINNVSPVTNTQYYINNSSSTTMVYDGKTVVLTAWALVVPCTQYHIKLAIGDVQDGSYDSGVFLEANSFSSSRITAIPNYPSGTSLNSAIEGCADAQIVLKLPFVRSTDMPIDYYLTGSATRGVDYAIDVLNPEYITIPAGQDSVLINIHPTDDFITETDEFLRFVITSNLCPTGVTIYDTVNINIINRDSLSLSVTGDTLLCEGDSTHLAAVAIGGLEPYQFLWNNNYNQLEQTLMPVDSITTYSFTVTDLCLYTATDSVKVVKSYVDLTVMEDVTICEGESVLLSGEGTGVISWTGLSGETPTVSPTQTTQYEAAVSNICGEAKDTVTVIVDLIPYFSLGGDTIVCDRYPIQIGIPIMDDAQYLWSNGYSSSQLQINSPNTYILNVTRGECNYSDTILVNPGFCDWWIPNAFSPDHTNINEEFKPVGVPIQQYEMIIFNRWGEVVFRTRDWYDGWDGTYRNEKAQSGVYIYEIFGEANASKIKGLVKQGQVTLMH